VKLWHGLKVMKKKAREEEERVKAIEKINVERQKAGKVLFAKNYSNKKYGFCENGIIIDQQYIPKHEIDSVNISKTGGDMAKMQKTVFGWNEQRIDYTEEYLVLTIMQKNWDVENVDFVGETIIKCPEDGQMKNYTQNLGANTVKFYRINDKVLRIAYSNNNYDTISVNKA
jgi:hypothetical protein